MLVNCVRQYFLQKGKPSMKKAISLLLLASMLFGAVACAEKVDDNNPAVTDAQVTAVEEETEPDPNPEPELPEYDGDASEFKITYRFNTNSYNEYWAWTEGEDGEVVNDAVYERNRAAEEKFNIKIVGLPSTTAGDDMRKAVTGADAAYDIVWDQKTTVASFASQNYLVDYNTVPYIDVNAQYWEANAARELTIGGKLFYMPNDMSISNFGGARFMYFNRKLITDYNLQEPYDYIFNNEWTLDVVLNMIQQVSADLNGDGKMTGEDQFGLLREDSGSNGNVMYFITAAGVKYTEKDENDVPVLSFNNEKTIKVMEMCEKVLKDKNTTIEYQNAAKGADLTGYNHLYEYCRAALFTTDHFLFVQNGIQETESFKDMQSDYGIAPNPKFDVSQEDYKHRLDIYTTIMVIPNTVTDLERTGIILEYLAWKSSKTVYPAYYEITIKTKRARDERDAMICDIVKGSINYEISEMFSLGINDVIWNAFNSGKYASTFEKNEKSLVRKIDKLVSQFDDSIG